MAKRLRCWLVGALAVVSTLATADDTVACHYTYGGETKVLRARPAKSPYDVKAIQVGSFFRFRVVFQAAPADLASVKVYTYSDREGGAVPIHQATFAYPVVAGKARGPYGFTGLHFVYEPMRDGELQYWCELEANARRNK